MKINCKYDALISVSELKEHTKNRNNHPKEQIDRLVKLFEYQGMRHPIIVSNLSGCIVVGHGRLMAAKKLGAKEVPVVYQDFDNADQEYAFLISDNAVAEWAELDLSGINNDIGDLGPDFDIDLLGLKDFTVTLEDKLEPGCDEDEIPEVKEPRSVLGDLYELGNHRLLCGDSTSIDAVEKLMKGEKADMVFTDPPYGINEETDRAFASPTRKAKGNTFDKIIGDDSIDTALGVYSIIDIISDIICYWGGNYYAHKLPPTPCWVVWDKRVEDKQRDMNSDCELAYVKHPSKESVRIFRHLWKGMIKGSEHGQGRVHPTQKPIALAEWCFNELNPDGKSVLDLFGGSGSTLIACEKTQRKCYMMELDPQYIDVIVSRYVKYSGNNKIKLNGETIEWQIQ
jgi:DNA modification methylase